MVFSSQIFLHLFLPLFLAAYFLVPSRFLRMRNLILLLFSLVFYTWGEPQVVWAMLACIAINWGAGLLITHGRGGETLEPGGSRDTTQKLALAGAVALSLSLLGYFKYANFFVDNLSALVHGLGGSFASLDEFKKVALPVGISFYTFQALSYTIDVYRGKVASTSSFLNFACYVSMFPQLVAGPIVRYQDVAEALVRRETDSTGFAAGVRRFIIGLAKKTLIANLVAIPADAIFGLPAEHLGTALCWVGALAYTLQIYYDFSAYSDMAIGLGQMLGFHFPENFLHPYASASIREFWRRWHISLSTWFRDYLYIPLGGNRASGARTMLNLWIVFLLCGFWHGASWNFVIWGAYHGAFLVIERLGLGALLEKLWAPFRHVYTMLAVTAGWVFFRADTMGQAKIFLLHMAGLGPEPSFHRPLEEFITLPVLLALVLGAIGSSGLPARWARGLDGALLGPGGEKRRAAGFLWSGASLVFAAGCLLLSLMHLASGAYNPFIYFRF